MQRHLHCFKKICLIALTLVFTYPALGQGKKQISLEDIYLNGTFAIKSVPGFNALKNGKQYTQLDQSVGGQQINSYSLVTGKKVKTLWQNIEAEQIGTVERYQFSQDEQKLLLFTQSEPVYRRSILYKVWVHDFKTGATKLVNENKVLHASFNAGGSKVAYVQNNNLFIYDLSSENVQSITTDGEVNKIINGNCDWVYEEEWEFTKAYEWSPNGEYLAYYRFDESQVKEFTMPYYEEGNYPRNYVYKYPKAGEANSVVSIHVYNLAQQNTVTVNVGSETDQYIPRIKWANAQNLCVYRMNRHQNHLDLLLANPQTGNAEVIYTEDGDQYVEIGDNLTFLTDGVSFVNTSERDGYNHLYLWNWSTKTMTQITQGSWDVANIQGVDVQKKEVFFTAGVNSPSQRKLYKVNWQTKQMDCLTNNDGTHDITPCKGLQFFLDKYTSYNRVPVYTLIDAKGKKIRVLEDNKALQTTMDQYALSVVTPTQLPNGKGDLLNAWMIKPIDFDPQKQYPLLMYQYSGPGSQEVMDRFPVGNYFWHQYLAQNGYIIVCVDGTGTGGRGQKFKKATYLQLGKYESDDQIAAAKFLSKLAYVDPDRIGIWGWSFGGFMSSICILKGADVFKTAVAVAPVTNWRLYDNIYTERYMRTPAENPKGYDDNAPEKMANLLKGNYLLIHGTADDNVHFQNAVVMTDKLIKANKQFRSEYYPNRNHGIGGGNTRFQLFTKITEYLFKHL